MIIEELRKGAKHPQCNSDFMIGIARDGGHVIGKCLKLVLRKLAVFKRKKGL